MSAILGNMKSALGVGSGDPSGLLDTLQNNPNVMQTVGQYMPQHIRQNLFLPEPGSDTFMGRHPAFAHSLENALIGVGQMNQIPQTTGQSISMVANSLMAGPMAHRQWQMQQVMMPFQIAQQMGAISKDQAEAAMNQAKARYFGSHGEYFDRGAGAGITDQTRTYQNMTPLRASDGKMYAPDAQLPSGVTFPAKTTGSGPYGGSGLWRAIAGMQGQMPEQTSGQLSPEELPISQARYADAFNKSLEYYKAQAAARNFAPGALDPNDRFLGDTAKAISGERVQSAQQYISKLQGKDYFSLVPTGVPDGEAWRQQEIAKTQQAVLGEQQRLMDSLLRHDYSPYQSDVVKGVQGGKYTPPSDNNPMAPALGAPAVAAPPQGMSGTNPQLSAPGAALGSTWFPNK